MLIVGLGNPGKEYEKTVHNLGFMATNLLLEKEGLKLKDKNCQALSTSFYAHGEKIIIAQPQTYMNLSGESVKQLLNYNKMGLEDLVVVYDDIDLPIGTIRIRKEGSAGTHNGMRNIIANLNGAKNFLRIRIGAGEDRGRMELKDYVLSKIVGERAKKVSKVLDKVVECLEDYIETKDIDLIMRRHNGVVDFD